MKKLLVTWVIVFLAIVLGWAQTENTLIQNFIPEEDCYFAIFALNAPANVQTWEEANIKVIYTLKTDNPNKNANNLQIEMQFYEEERVMIFEVPNQEKKVLMNTENLGEFLEIEIFVPHGIKYHVVPANLHPLM